MQMNITYAISNWIYGTEPLEEAFKRLKRYGYNAIELMVEDPGSFPTSKVKALMEQHDLPCCSVCTKMPGAEGKDARMNLIDENKDVRDRTLAYLKGSLETGVELNARLSLTVPSGVANTRDAWTRENKETMVQQLGILGDHARECGDIFLAIEPINRYENAFMRRGEQALELLEELNHSSVKMMLDFFHTNIEEDNNGMAIRQARNHLIHCHVADSNRKSCGRGNTDWFEIMRALKDIDFHGSLACEPLPPTGADVYESMKGTRPEADDYARECIEYLRFIESVI